MVNYYEINVSLHGRHLFATAPRSLTSKQDYDKCLEMFKVRFLKSDGFEITASHETHRGLILDVNES